MTSENSLIMVVEDDSMLLDAVAKKLTIAGLKSILCTSGTEAIKKLESDSQLPTVIWLDYHLQDMNGLEFMAKLKQNPSWEQIPVIVVSNSATEENIHSMLAIGAKEYILKAEHRLEDIVETVKNLKV